jgi:hypothetical protein
VTNLPRVGKIFTEASMAIAIPVPLLLYCFKVVKIMPPPKNPLLVHNFIEAPDPDGGKCQRFTCIHCKNDVGANSHRALDHLKPGKCPVYKRPSSEASSSFERPAKRQQTLQLGVPTISKSKKQKLDRAASMAIYIGARPFALFDEPYMKAFIDLLSDSLYKTPSRHLIGGNMLDEIYKELQSKILQLLDQQKYLQFILDESPDLNHRRIINLSVVIPGYGSFYLENEHIGDRTLNAQFFVEWFFQKTKRYCSDPKRMSSLSTDTCATMQKTWTGLAKHPLLAHSFFVPCDSHSLQLLIKDILESKPFSDTITKAQSIVSTFHRAKKQYAIL